MSQWTQVSGSIRIDGLVFGEVTDSKIKESIEKKLGTIVTFESNEELWNLPKEKTTPMGSEGGLRYEYITTAKDTSSLSRGSLFIEGSLRDYGGVCTSKDCKTPCYYEDNTDYKEIIEWLNRAFAGEHKRGDLFFIRQGIIEIVVESNVEKILLIWNEELNNFEEHKIILNKK
ncbi:MAG: hypothetical protein KJI69_04905 [Patescibacteria group bacterium]|nr:hypothetical protein [Patescibacteria group bacterium]